MYVRVLDVTDVRALRSAQIRFSVPSESNGDLPNITLLLGDNGTGKTTLLTSTAIACLGLALEDSGFVPYYQVRRTGTARVKVASFEAELWIHHVDAPFIDAPRAALWETSVEIRRRYDKEIIRAEDFADERVWRGLYAKDSPGFIVLGYGATRRVDRSESFDPSQSLRQRSARYQRVASLFEDHVPLTPVGYALATLRRDKRWKEFHRILRELLPSDLDIILSSKKDREFVYLGVPLPFWALSDGYRAYVGLVLDILYQLCVASKKTPDPPTQIPAIVLIDEIDLHLHPTWQREVVPRLARALPSVQFVLTTHSAIVAGTVPSESIRVLERDESGEVIIAKPTVDVWGKSADEILLSRYFGLSSTRAPGAELQLHALAQQALAGDDAAASEYLQVLAGELSLHADDAPTKKGAVRKKRGPTNKKGSAKKTGTAKKKKTTAKKKKTRAPR